MFRTRQLFGFQNGKRLSNPPVLEVSSLRFEQQKICLSRCDISYNCLACQLTDRPIHFVTTTVLWMRRLLRRSNVCKRKMAWLTWQICLRKFLPPISVEHYVVTSCTNGSMPWVILDLHVGEVLYPLERLRSVGFNTRSWRTNQRAELNHSIPGVHDFTGTVWVRTIRYGNC